VTSGSSYCQVTPDGACITDGDGDYGNHERCTVQALASMVVSAQVGFITEPRDDVHCPSGCDYITIRGTR
jgi:hypothetical protein